MIQKKNELTLRECKIILRYFQKLRAIVEKKTPTKKNSLWENVKTEAKEDFIEELRARQNKFTLPPNGLYKAARERNQSHSKQDQFNRIIERKAEKKYRVLDSKYDSKLKRREQEGQELVKKIDYTITAHKEALAEYPEANDTLLRVDWKDLRKKFYIREIMKFNEQELFDRAIRVLEIITTKLNQSRRERRMGKIWSGCIELYNYTIGAAFTYMKQ